jgi:lipopolysaccharide/colanic/teichoic acid biosynthesis glycosyltransferase
MTTKNPVAPSRSNRTVSATPTHPARATLPIRRLAAVPVPVLANYRWKREFDVVLSILLLLVTFPVLCGTLLLVRLTSRGPALYSQKRVGRGGRVFVIYKVRTMFQDCEKGSGIRWSTPGDPRITTVGKVLRALHLDELPQLWNVIIGDMSLVGPRPERPEIVDDLRVSMFGYDRRHAVLPGITGFAQIHLPPDSSIQTVRNKLIYDRHAICKMSLGFDLYCLICTGLKVLGLKRFYHRPPRKIAG